MTRYRTKICRGGRFRFAVRQGERYFERVVTLELTRLQAIWLLDAAERCVAEWGVRPEDATHALDAIAALRKKFDPDA